MTPQEKLDADLLNLVDHSDYEAIIASLANLPLTWLPGLLAEITQECVRRPVFRDAEKLVRFVERAAAMEILRMTMTSEEVKELREGEWREKPVV